MTTMKDLGLTDEIASACGELIPARVCTTPSHGQLTALTPQPVEATMGSRFVGLEPEEQPALGDWVALRDAGGLYLVERLLPRRSAFIRKAAGRTQRRQVLAANIDTVFVVTALDGDLNVRRLERYLTVILDGGATPVVVVNKCDVEHDGAAVRESLETIGQTARVVFMSATTGEGIDQLKLRGTVAFLGSSGVGKSTLVNRIFGTEIQATGEVRADDGKGRHTTTRGELLVLGDVCLIDTPGIRELGLAGVGEGLDATFSDIGELAKDCRFRDCSHHDEPGCAVQRAIFDGNLDAARFASYEALQREAAWAERRSDARAAKDNDRRWKEIHKGLRQRQVFNKKHGLKPL